MSQVQRSKASKPCPAYKVRRARQELIRRVRAQTEFERDCEIALRAAYVDMYDRAQAHNVTFGAFAPRASPAVH